MSKIKLVLKSSEVAGDFANINIVVNSNVVDQARQLSATPETVIIDAALSDQNTLYFDILNPRAIDVNGDGQFDSVNDLTMYVTLLEMYVSVDGVDFQQFLPKVGQNIKLKDAIPPHEDKGLRLFPKIDPQKFWSAQQILEFSRTRVIRNGAQQFPELTVQGNQIFENGVLNQELTDSYYWG
jgi:hypothetical protein